MGEPQPILVLHQPADHRYFQPGVQSFEVARLDGGAVSGLCGEAAKQFSQFAEIAQDRGAGQGNAESPELQEVADPLRVAEEIGEVAIAVPHFAIGQIHPGSRLAEFVDAELVGSGDHSNEIKLLDSLHGSGYSVK